jgi:hypothetical protein
MPQDSIFSHVTMTAPNQKAFEKTLEFFNVLGFRTISYTNKSTNDLEPVTINVHQEKQEACQDPEVINEAWLHLFTPGGQGSGVTIHVYLGKESPDEEQAEAMLEKVMERQQKLQGGEFDMGKQMCFSFTVASVEKTAEKFVEMKVPFHIREGEEGHKTAFCYDSLGTLMAFTDRPLPFAKTIEAGMDTSLPPLTCVFHLIKLTC